MSSNGQAVSARVRCAWEKRGLSPFSSPFSRFHSADCGNFGFEMPVSRISDLASSAHHGSSTVEREESGHELQTSRSECRHREPEHGRMCHGRHRDHPYGTSLQQLPAAGGMQARCDAKLGDGEPLSASSWQGLSAARERPRQTRQPRSAAGRDGPPGSTDLVRPDASCIPQRPPNRRGGSGLAACREHGSPGSPIRRPPGAQRGAQGHGEPRGSRGSGLATPGSPGSWGAEGQVLQSPGARVQVL